MKKSLNLRANIALGLVFSFLANILGPCPVYAQEAFRLPAPGVMVHLSPEFNPPILKGIKVHPDNPFRFDFILDKGDSSLSSPNVSVGDPQQEQLKTESTRLIKYFLASLTIPEKDLWVNLSPYEKDRIIPQSFGLTEMGRDLLAEDYMLKQITASLIYPEDEIGKKFWKRIYEEAAKRYGTTNIPVNTFNKVWIVPEKAVVYENAKAGTAYVVESKLKVMLEQDYLSLSKNTLSQPGDMFKQEQQRTCPQAGCQADKALKVKASQGIPDASPINALGFQIVREIVIPELTKEVNENKNFAQLRQVYNSLILATWYKKKIKDSILEQVYADKKKVAGVGYDKSVIQNNTVILSVAKDLNKINSVRDSSSSTQNDNNLRNDTELIYQRYLQAFKKGVYNYIKEEAISVPGMPSKEQGILPRKYFSGGMLLEPDQAMEVTQLAPNNFNNKGDLVLISIQIDAAMEATGSSDAAMSVEDRLGYYLTLLKEYQGYYNGYIGIVRKMIYDSLLFDYVPRSEKERVRERGQTYDRVQAMRVWRNIRSSFNQKKNPPRRVVEVTTPDSYRIAGSYEIYLRFHEDVLSDWQKQALRALIYKLRRMSDEERNAMSPADKKNFLIEIAKEVKADPQAFVTFIQNEVIPEILKEQPNGALARAVLAHRNDLAMTSALLDSFPIKDKEGVSSNALLKMADRAMTANVLIQHNPEILLKTELKFQYRPGPYEQSLWESIEDPENKEIGKRFRQLLEMSFPLDVARKVRTDIIADILPNAVDAMYKKYNDEAPYRHSPGDWISIPFRVIRKQGVITISIKDQGTGIPPDLLSAWKEGIFYSLGKERGLYMGRWGEAMQDALDVAEELKAKVGYSTFYNGEHWVFSQDETGKRELYQEKIAGEGTEVTITLKADKAMGAGDQAMAAQGSAGPIVSVPLKGGARLLTRLSRHDLFFLGRFFERRVTVNSRGDLVVQASSGWVKDNTSFDFLNKYFNLVKRIEELDRHRSNKGQPIVVLDWGCGDGSALIGLLEELKKREIPNVVLYGYGNDYYTAWRKAPEGINFILDTADHLKDYLGQYKNISLVYSFNGLEHLFDSDQDRNFAVKHFRDLSDLLGNDGVLLMLDRIERLFPELSKLYNIFPIAGWSAFKSSRAYPHPVELKPTGGNRGQHTQLAKQPADRAMGANQETHVEQQLEAEFNKIILKLKTDYGFIFNWNDILRYFASIDVWDPGSKRRIIRLSLEEQETVFKYIWLRRSSNFRSLYAGDPRKQGYFDHIIHKLTAHREIPIPPFYFAHWTGDHLNGTEMGGFYSYGDLTLEEEKVLWELFELGNLGANRDFYSSDISEIRSKINTIIQSSKRPVTILDLGCGRKGRILKDLKELYGNKISLAVGIDLLVRTNGAEDGVTLMKGDIREIPFADNSFDIVLSSFSLYFRGEKESRGRLDVALSEAIRVSRKYFLITGGTPDIKENLSRRKDIVHDYRGDKFDSIFVEKKNVQPEFVAQGPKNGGIDLTRANMNVQVRTGSPTKAFGDDSGGLGNDNKEGGDDTPEGIKFHLDPAMLRQLQNAPGFVPVIINIQPLTDLREFLGLSQSISHT